MNRVNDGLGLRLEVGLESDICESTKQIDVLVELTLSSDQASSPLSGAVESSLIAPNALLTGDLSNIGGGELVSELDGSDGVRLL